MNVNQQELTADNIGQSPGCDPKTTKRNSGLFSFLKWFKPSTSRESVDLDVQNSHSSSCDSLTSLQSTGTVASFSYIPPSAYNNKVSEKYINPGPETDTYKARLKQREKRRENDKNLTLRKKYNLFFSRDTLKPPSVKEEDNSRSLPLMTRKTDEEEKMHRRTASESSKIKRAGAYCHVKGKRKAPQPPGSKVIHDGHSTMSLKRKKRLAPPPPAVTHEKVINTLEYADADVIFNDSLKLDHGVLKPVKEPDVVATTEEKKANLSPNASARSSYVEAPVSPRPWYKRNTSRDSVTSTKKEHKYEPVERLPDVPYTRNSTIDLTIEEVKVEKKKEDKRKSGLSFLTNISELDREASEIIRREHQKNGTTEIPEMPEFMRPKQDPKIGTDSWASPKRKSARDLIAKFNAITNVTKVTVNTALFGSKDTPNVKREYFEKQHSVQEKPKKSSPIFENKALERIRKLSSDENKFGSPLMKSESASAIKSKPETPKFEKKSWYCPKCSIENEYWRIICHVCSAIKPYFDDLTSPPKNNNVPNTSKTQNEEVKQLASNRVADTSKNTLFKPITEGPGILERSKTQIGFSVLARYNETQTKQKKLEKSVSVDQKPTQKEAEDKKEEREKLKKMLIEMKNSLPKRKSAVNMKSNNRASIIDENPEIVNKENAKPAEKTENPRLAFEKNTKPVNPPENKEEKVVEITVATQETIYENIKVKKTEEPAPIKVSSSAQTSAVVRKILPSASTSYSPKKEPEVDKRHNNFELMRPKDFANIYSDKMGKSTAAHIYENLAKNDKLSLFFNMPKRFSEIKNELNANAVNNTDTLEINRLLRRLESAIAKGEMAEAALFAQELAQLKINCSVIRQKSQDDSNASGKDKSTVFT